MNSSSAIHLTTQQARTYAKDAYIFTYPLVLNYRTMFMQAINQGAFGKWLHLGFASPADTHIVTPNNDTPYSWAWVDLRAEPWVLTMPEIDEGRYYTSQWNDLWGYVLDNPGSINDGYGGGSYLLAAPDWEGTTPEGVKRVIRDESTILGTLTRTQRLEVHPCRWLLASGAKPSTLRARRSRKGRWRLPISRPQGASAGDIRD